MSGLKVDDQVVETGVGDETVLLHLTSGIYFGLDATGTFIWARIKDGLDSAQILDAMVDAFDVTREQAKEDLEAFIAELESHEIVRGDDAVASQ